jgi:hypothetical protein
MQQCEDQGPKSAIIGDLSATVNCGWSPLALLPMSTRPTNFWRLIRLIHGVLIAIDYTYHGIRRLQALLTMTNKFHQKIISIDAGTET